MILTFMVSCSSGAQVIDAKKTKVRNDQWGLQNPLLRSVLAMLGVRVEGSFDFKSREELFSVRRH